MKKPNLVLFMPDQFRADHLGHLSYTSASCTPVLDSLVHTDAVSFGMNFCQNPVCTPSRCSLMSGWYPHVRGHRTMNHMLHEDEPHLLQLLKENGYYVWWGGKNDMIPGDSDMYRICSYRNPVPRDRLASNTHSDLSWRGTPDSPLYYSFYAGIEPPMLDTGDSYNSDLHHVTSACEFIRNYDRCEPFVVFLPLDSPHPPYYVEQKWYDAITEAHLPQQIPVPEWDGKPSILQGIYQRQGLSQLADSEWKAIRTVYAAMCMRLDHQAGMILDSLKDSGCYDNTAFFFISDHGDYTGNYGLVEKTQNTFEDCLTHVPLIIKPPHDYDITVGVRSGLTENLDIYATILDMADIPSSHWHFGKSLLPYLNASDPHIPIRSAVYCEGGRLLHEDHCKEAAPQEGSLYWPRVGLQQPDEPMYHSKATMLRTEQYKYVKRLYEPDEFYDLQKDPYELHNLISDSAYADIIRSLKEQMLDFYMENSDVVPLTLDPR